MIIIKNDLNFVFRLDLLAREQRRAGNRAYSVLSGIFRVPIKLESRPDWSLLGVSFKFCEVHPREAVSILTVLFCAFYAFLISCHI